MLLHPVAQVGVDPKAVSDAWTGIEKKHGDKVAALFVSVDETKGKALAYAGQWVVSLQATAQGLQAWKGRRSISFIFVLGLRYVST